ncbi:MAG: hypothetical protein H6704_27815 [Myxococcales bacterium]|nr:hypothetical protein [Myxococcales bacterium]
MIPIRGYGFVLGVLIVVAPLAASARDSGPAEGVGAATGPSNASAEADAAPPADVRDFICPHGFHRAFPVDRALELPPRAAVAEAWRVLRSERAPRRCWGYATLTIGLLGDTDDVAKLIAFVTEGRQKRTKARIITYLPVPRALGFLVGRGRDDGTRGLDFLLGCTRPDFWTPYAGQLTSADGDTRADVIARKLSQVCIPALGMTRTQEALEHLERIVADPTSTAVDVSEARIGLRHFREGVERGSTIAPWRRKAAHW